MGNILNTQNTQKSETTISYIGEYEDNNLNTKEKLLITACKYNRFKKIKKLLKSGNGIDIHYDKEKALWWACYTENITIVKFLLDYSIKYNTMKDIELFTYRLFDISYGATRIYIMKYILEYYEKYYDKYKYGDIYKYCLLDDCYIRKSFGSSPDSFKLLLDYRFKMGIPFNIESNEEYFYHFNYNKDSIEIYKILFEYSEKMNYKLNIYKKTHPACDEYLIYLDKHNYYNYSRYHKVNNTHILMELCIHKKIKKYKNKSYECIYMGVSYYCKYIHNNNNIYDLNYFNNELHNIDYILKIPTI